jgi:transaldolase/glucose-6-phosphate isomerase
MNENPVKQIQKYRQSIWLDFIRRHMLQNGQLDEMIGQYGLRGVTSNPSIFEKAIAGSQDYDDAIRRMALAGKSTQEIYQTLTVNDVRQAADLFLPVYEETHGGDGFVSLEVSPHLAHDTQATIDEARRLWSALDRPNVLIKVPATVEGLPAIEQLISEGINVNVTLLFGLPRYRQVAQAYIAGLEKRLSNGGTIDRIASVASFFVSRIDVMVDPMLEKAMVEEPEGVMTADELHGEVAIACAKLAYQQYKEIFNSSHFQRLQQEGARPQRLLWASTSTKNPSYSDVRYVEALIGSNTVNTIPLETLHAYADHGQPQSRLEHEVDEAQHVLNRLPNFGIDLSNVVERLEEEGVQKFSRSYDQLMQTLEGERVEAKQHGAAAMMTHLGQRQAEVEARLTKLQQDKIVQRLWRKDASLWASQPEAQLQIKDSLGWLHVAKKIKENLGQLYQFVHEIKLEGFEQVVHMGMGGSSLAPMLFAEVFPPTEAGLPLTVLDTTDPETISCLEEYLPLERTLFIVASKSGGTAETLAFGEYFYHRLEQLVGDKAGDHFIAITDPGTDLETIAHQRRFRRVFLNYTDIGGRFSALSYFGLVPAALAGVDVDALIERSLRMQHACAASVPAEENPGLRLGAVLGELGLQGRDKVTFVLPESLKTFGMWLEQLLAESTGKQGKGLIPVVGEAMGKPEVYGDDRLFVHIYLASDQDQSVERLKLLEEAGHPVLKIQLEDLLDIGQEFFRWEFATAVAGHILGINAFNQPNVQESKDNTEQLLREFQESGSLPEDEPHLVDEGLQVFCDEARGDLEVTLAQFLLEAKPSDYFAVMAYLTESPEMEARLETIRLMVRDWLKVATTLGCGPRFLHSTGQLHKGGPNTGLFLQFTADSKEDVDIPGKPYSFGTLRQAQYLGDYQALKSHKRRVMRIHLGSDPKTSLSILANYLNVATKPLSLANRSAYRRRSREEKVTQ